MSGRPGGRGWDDGRGNSRPRFEDRRGGRGGPPRGPLRFSGGKRPSIAPINREKTCPALLRVFPKVGGHYTAEDFEQLSNAHADEIHLYTWRDASLRELCNLIQQHNEHARQPSSKLSLSLVYPGKNGGSILRSVGSVHATQDGPDDTRTLNQVRYQPGDYLSVSILTS